MEKKGFVFTLISSLFVSVILIAFLIQATNTTRVKTEQTRVKVETMNAFLKSIENTHINNSVKITTSKAFDSMVECIRVDKGTGKEKLFTNPQDALKSIMKSADLSEAKDDKKKE